MPSKIDLPPCEAKRLGDIADLITSALSSRSRREKLGLVMKRKGYIPKLLQLFKACKKSKATKALRQLNGIMKAILQLGKTSLFEVMFSEKYIMDVIGCLEYDPSLAQPKHHKQLSRERAKLKKIVPIKDPKIQKKFHQMYQAQYIQANFLPNPPDFGENYPFVLNSFIHRKKEEILRVLEKDEEFLSDLFAQLTNEDTAEDERLELGMDDLQVRGVAADILSDLAGYRPFMVQEFVMKEAQQSHLDTNLISVLTEQLIRRHSAEFGEAEQLTDLLCTLLDPGNLLPTAKAAQVFQFLNYFYTCCLPVLTAPLLANAAEGTCEIDAFQFVNKVIGLRDEFYNHYIAQGNLLEPFLLAVLENGAVYHLLIPTVIELLEFIKLEDGMSLGGYLADNFCQALGSINYVQTFGLKTNNEKEEQQQEQKVNSVPHRGSPSKKVTLRSAVAAPKVGELVGGAVLGGTAELYLV
ncbi:protein phosphatase 4 regulatory subunit 3B [Pitangus sulphuratus]|nr:protein phosphatase 4 regulatory subunit 3B [Pitangus sulphuratus]